MWIVALLALGVVVALWQVILAGLILWALVTCIRWWLAAVAVARPKPRPPPEARPDPARGQAQTQARPDPARGQAQAQPVRELPAPDYLPRWTASRRLDADREHAQWQEAFDRQGA